MNLYQTPWFHFQGSFRTVPTDAFAVSYIIMRKSCNRKKISNQFWRNNFFLALFWLRLQMVPSLFFSIKIVHFWPRSLLQYFFTAWFCVFFKRWSAINSFFVIYYEISCIVKWSDKIRCLNFVAKFWHNLVLGFAKNSVWVHPLYEFDWTKTIFNSIL